MTKPIHAADILAALPPEARADFQKQINDQAGVNLNIKVSKRKSTRKGNWDNVKGRVVSARVSSYLYLTIKRTAKTQGITIGEFVARCCQHEIDASVPEEDLP
jgi:hypothetical protein